MGYVLIDKRGPEPVAWFYVGNGKKNIPVASCPVPKLDKQTIEECIAPVLEKLRGRLGQSGIVR